MKFYKFWGRSQATVEKADGSMVIDCHGWSDSSLEDAIHNAKRIAQRTAAAVQAGGPPRAYDYNERPLREEILEEHPIDGQLAAVITRNAYGARVLNTAGALFADIDYPEASSPSLIESVKGLFRRASTPSPDEQISNASTP